MAKRFFEKINQLNSDILSCRCKNFSVKQVSKEKKNHFSNEGGSGPTGPHPTPPTPWIHHCIQTPRSRLKKNTLRLAFSCLIYYFQNSFPRKALTWSFYVFFFFFFFKKMVRYFLFKVMLNNKNTNNVETHTCIILSLVFLGLFVVRCWEVIQYMLYLR